MIRNANENLLYKFVIFWRFHLAYYLLFTKSRHLQEMILQIYLDLFWSFNMG